MNKTDLENLAEIRISEAKTLLDNDNYHGAYYLAGYALECAIKACIAKQVKKFDFPDKKLAQNSHQHKLPELINVAGIKAELDSRQLEDVEFQSNWAVVKDWTVESRYDRFITKPKAIDLYSAITDKQSGVLTWLKTFL
jgi:AbiV family abortive infection protein